MSSLAQDLLPTPIDGLVTDTSEQQSRTESTIQELLTQYILSRNQNGINDQLRFQKLKLDRPTHIRWLLYLLNPLPAPYTSLDASRPWMIYWVAHSLALMNATFDSELKCRAIETIKSFWNKEQGGFGGGPGQMAHLAPTYASVSALCYLGEADVAWEWLDRQAIHDWMLTLKQPDGSFVMHTGGEIDVRGCYCAIVTAVLLNILTPDLVRGTFQFIASCQTYEGGLASASHPDLGDAPPLGESHGGYTFCALASHFVLLSSPSLQTRSQSNNLVDDESSGPCTLNVHSLLRWATSMQGLPIEAGGFRGRSNKLVDGCYSWWCAGLFSILSALLPTASGSSKTEAEIDLFNREAIQEYILIAAQTHSGGLRDKPGKGPDAYHSCYNLSGLSAAQHMQIFNDVGQRQDLERQWIRQDGVKNTLVKGVKETSEDAERRMKDIFCSSLAWTELEERKIIIGLKENETILSHSVYSLTMQPLDRMLRWSYGQPPKVGLEEIVEI